MLRVTTKARTDGLGVLASRRTSLRRRAPEPGFGQHAAVGRFDAGIDDAGRAGDGADIVEGAALVGGLDGVDGGRGQHVGGGLHLGPARMGVALGFLGREPRRHRQGREQHRTEDKQVQPLPDR
ncbi:MAG: hypothetical protein WDN06_04945 [Asticcacaulis sp.]